jgi:peptidoglycan/xylan/chitin deacetylase (PgdA/CDA1 family)
MKKSLLARLPARMVLAAFMVMASVPAWGTSTALASGPNIVPNPSVETAGTNGNPQSWARGRWGTNTATYTYPVAGSGSPKAVKVDITSYTSGDAKWWFQEVPISPNQQYTFSDSYTSTISSRVTVQYRQTDGTFKYVDLGTLPASTAWRTGSFTFTTPANVTKITVFHLIKAVGSLTVDNYSLTSTTVTGPHPIVTINIDDGVRAAYEASAPVLEAAGMRGSYYIITHRFDFPAYMTAQEVLQAQAAGHEIGAHTRTHPDLTALTADQVRDEVAGSVTDLKNIGIRSVDTFAYPFGAYNDTTRSVVDTLGFKGVRTSNGGFNTPTTNKMLLSRHGVEVNTTLDQVKSWVNDAIKSNSWLILVFHHIDTSGQQYSTTPQEFQDIVNYLKQTGIDVRTTRDAIAQYYL